MITPYSIYRHFKGGLYLILACALTEDTCEPTVVYMSLNGDNRVWTRSLSDFESIVPEGKPNPTGQEHRFELVRNLSSILGQCTTANLIEELKSRPDSPFNEVDIEGLNDKVVDREYIIGELVHTMPGYPPELRSVTAPKDTLEEAKFFVQNYPHRCSSRTKIFKSVLIEVESFD